MSLGTLRFEDTEAWMLANGWRIVSEGRGGWMWQNLQVDGRIGVVRNLGQDPHAQAGLIERLSAAHQRPLEEVRDELRFWSFDVTYVRAANDIVVADSIPLHAGATMVESARLMFRSAASAAFRLRPVIRGGYSKLGDEVARSVRMGHTIKGSYIIPVEVHVGEPRPVELDDDNQPEITGFDSVTTVESLERRMTRTFAQAMSAIETEIVTADRLPRGDALLHLVSQGVTAEFVDAVGRVLEHQEVAQIDTSFRWAHTQDAPPGVSQRVEIPKAAQEVIRRTGLELRSGKLPKVEMFTGPVVRVAHEPGEPTTMFAIRTYRSNRLCRIWAETKEPLSTVTDWMNDKTTVQVRGFVDRTSQGLWVQNARVAELTELLK